MLKWKRICRSKQKGGLGVLDLEKQNISLMTKWWWKLETQDGLWQKIVKAKYFRNQTVASVKPRFNDSPCWKNIFKVKETYMAGRKIILNSGNLMRLWLDPWYNNKNLSDQFPQLFDLCQKQNCTIAEFVDCNFLIPFRRRLLDDMLIQWNEIVARVQGISFNASPDSSIWSLHKKGIFTTKFVYNWLEKKLAGADNK